MSEPLNRDEVIGLLNDLGSEEDETVLAAARAVHAKLAAAELTWQDLLRPEDGEEAAGEAEPEAETWADDSEADSGADPGADPGADSGAESGADSEDGADSDNAEPAETETAPGKDAESLALIEALLAKAGISDDLRQELEDYKSDIAEGEFGPGDRKYLRAVHKRLMN